MDGSITGIASDTMDMMSLRAVPQTVIALGTNVPAATSVIRMQLS